MSAFGVVLAVMVAVDGGVVGQAAREEGVHSEVVGTNGQGHGALAGVLQQLHADMLICGGIGAGARTALAEAGIQLCPGVSGGADESVEALLKGTLSYDPDTQCAHHHEEGHQCRSGSCGEDKHGCSGNQ